MIEPFQKMLTRVNGDIVEAITDALNAACNEVHAEAGTFWFYSRFGDGMIHPRFPIIQSSESRQRKQCSF